MHEHRLAPTSLAWIRMLSLGICLGLQGLGLVDSRWALPPFGVAFDPQTYWRSPPPSGIQVPFLTVDSRTQEATVHRTVMRSRGGGGHLSRPSPHLAHCQHKT